MTVSSVLDSAGRCAAVASHRTSPIATVTGRAGNGSTSQAAEMTVPALGAETAERSSELRSQLGSLLWSGS
jgi:hypothetical protein